MMKVWALCVVAVVVLMLPSDGDAECCRQLAKSAQVGLSKGGVSGGWSPICGDCTLPTPCCGHGKCNLFCCACRGSCRGGCKVKRFYEEEPALVTLEEATSTANDLISAADEDGDGRMSLDEAHAHLAKRGLPAHRVRRSLMSMDLDNDNFLSSQEIDPSEVYVF